jgi:hypothetical protein
MCTTLFALAVQETAAADLAQAVRLFGAVSRWLEPAQLALLRAAEECGREPMGLAEAAAGLRRVFIGLAEPTTAFSPAACQQLQLLASLLCTSLQAVSGPSAAVTAAAGFLASAGRCLDPEAQQAVLSVQLAEQLTADCPQALRDLAARQGDAAGEVAAAMEAQAPAGALLQLLPEGPLRNAQALASATDPATYMAACCAVSSGGAPRGQPCAATQLLGSLARCSASRVTATQAGELAADAVAVLVSPEVAARLRVLLNPKAGPEQILLAAAEVASAAVLPAAGGDEAGRLGALYAGLHRLATRPEFAETGLWTENSRSRSFEVVYAAVFQDSAASTQMIRAVYKMALAAHQSNKWGALEVRNSARAAGGSAWVRET